jgi:hypothetical protein
MINSFHVYVKFAVNKNIATSVYIILNKIVIIIIISSSRSSSISPYWVGPSHHNMARLQVVDGGTDSSYGG